MEGNRPITRSDAMTDAEQQLLPLLRERCYKEGDFVLSSGKRSKHYFDGKMIQMHSAGATLIGEIFYERTKDLDFDAIGGLEIGAIPLTTSTVYAYHNHERTMEGFIVRNKAKEHGTKKIIEGWSRPGSRVVVVDDVVTQGGSVLKAIDAIRKAEETPILILALVDRLEGAEQAFQKAGIPYQAVFTIEDVASVHVFCESH
jgi:orotate phosphoribosyltransferase